MLQPSSTYRDFLTFYTRKIISVQQSSWNFIVSVAKRLRTPNVLHTKLFRDSPSACNCCERKENY